MPRATLHIVIGIGRKRPLLRDTLATTAREAKIIAVNNILRDYPAYKTEIDGFGWRTMHEWGFRCVPVRMSYRLPR